VDAETIQVLTGLMYVTAGVFICLDRRRGGVRWVGGVIFALWGVTLVGVVARSWDVPEFLLLALAIGPPMWVSARTLVFLLTDGGRSE
jgi:hypothetical protein